MSSSHRHARHDTDRTVLSSLAGGVNWAWATAAISLSARRTTQQAGKRAGGVRPAKAWSRCQLMAEVSTGGYASTSHSSVTVELSTTTSDSSAPATTPSDELSDTTGASAPHRPTTVSLSSHTRPPTTTAGGGQTEQLPRASTTKGPPQKQ